jgi:hypothetical protein
VTAVAQRESTDLVMPRICHVPDAVDWSIGDHAIEWCREHTLRLDPEQEFMLRSMLGVDENGRWQSFEFALSAPRQNGKGEVLLARELYGIFVLDERLIIHSAHEFKTSARHFQRLEKAIRDNDDLLARIERSELGSMRLVGFRYSHGDEAITLQDGSKIEFRTRTKSGLKGVDDVAVLVLDEAQILSEWAHGTMVPTLRASTAERGPQLVYAGNAPDQDKDDHAIVWTRVRERGIEAEEDSLVYHEYSLDFESPDEVPEEVARDPKVWPTVNWAMGRGRVTEKHMMKEIRLLGWRQFITELLNVGDYPDTDLVGNSEISQEKWMAGEDPESVMVDPVCLSFDVSPGRRTTITAAGLNEKGRKMVEMVHCRAGTGWVPERMQELCETHEVIELVCDGFGPANAIANKIEEQTGLDVRRLKTGEYADACGQFATAVEEDDLAHLGQDELNTSVRGARTRPLVDRWAWSRSKSKTDPGPVISASIGLWSAMDRDIANSEVMIF